MCESKLNLIQNIRRRPGMYIGDLTIRGLKNMIGYFLDDIQKDNSSNIEITIEFKKDNWVKIQVNKIDTSLFAETISSLNTDNKFISLGLPVMIALSEEIKINVQKLPSLISLWANKGIYEYAATTAIDKIDRIEVNFKIDFDIFNSFSFNYEIINGFIRKYAFIYSNFKIVSIDSTKDIKQTNLFEYPNGVSDQLDYKIAEQLHGIPLLRLDLKVNIDEYDYQICFCYLDIWLGQTYIATYANYDELIFGGSLENGILDGIILTFQEYSKSYKNKVKINYKSAKEQLILIAVAKGHNFNFAGSTKCKLEMPKMRKSIKQYVYNQLNYYLKTNEAIAEKVLDKFRIYE